MTDYVYPCAVITNNSLCGPRRPGRSLITESHASREKGREVAVPSSLGSVVMLPRAANSRPLLPISRVRRSAFGAQWVQMFGFLKCSVNDVMKGKHQEPSA